MSNKILDNFEYTKFDLEYAERRIQNLIHTAAKRPLTKQEEKELEIKNDIIFRAGKVEFRI